MVLWFGPMCSLEKLTSRSPFGSGECFINYVAELLNFGFLATGLRFMRGYIEELLGYERLRVASRATNFDAFLLFK